MTKEYFENHRKKIEEVMAISDVYYRKALFYKYMYKFTGLNWAKSKNQHYVEEAQKLLIGGLGVIIVDMAILDTYIRNNGE